MSCQPQENNPSVPGRHDQRLLASPREWYPLSSPNAIQCNATRVTPLCFLWRAGVPEVIMTLLPTNEMRIIDTYITSYIIRGVCVGVRLVVP